MAVAGLSVALPGCFSPKEEAAHRAAEIRWEVADAAIAASSLPERRVTWAEAVERLRAHGPAVLRSNDAVQRAEIAAVRPYRNLIPQIDARAGFVEQLTTIGGLTAEDIVYDVFVTNLLGGLVNLPEQVFLTQLSLLRTRLQREQAWREQVVTLHALFLQSAELRERRRVASLALANAERIEAAGVVPPGGQTVDALQDAIRDLDISAGELNARVGQLLGDPVVQWVLLGTGAAGVSGELFPSVDAGSILGDGLEEALLDSLRLRIAATELVGADAQVRSGWLDYLPQPEVFLTAPPIFTQTAGNQTVFELGNLTLSARLRLTIDVRGSIAERIRLAKMDRETALREARLAVRTAAVEAVRFRDQLDRLGEDEADAHRRLELLRSAVVADGLFGLQRRVSEAARVRASMARTELEAVSLVAPLLTLDKVWSETFPYADALTPGRVPVLDDDAAEPPSEHASPPGTPAPVAKDPAGAGGVAGVGNAAGDARGV